MWHQIMKKGYKSGYRPKFSSAKLQVKSSCFCNNINPFMHNIRKWPNIPWKLCVVNQVLKYVGSFFNFMHERVERRFGPVNTVEKLSAQ